MSDAIDRSEDLVKMVLGRSPSAKVVEHPPTKTSQESMEARHKASGERVVGAKALLIKVDVSGDYNVFVVVVLPGPNKLNSKVLKNELKDRIPGARNFRFATAEEMAQVAPGIQPGKMPPFGRPFFPEIKYTFVDESLLGCKRIGFNAAHFEKSIIMDTKDYLSLVVRDGVFCCSDQS